MIEQGTDEWHMMRLGKVTASQMANVMMKPDLAGFKNYQAQLVCERLTGVYTPTFKSAAMEHGTETEEQARAMYTMATGNMVQEVAFVDHPSIAMAGCSPDGLIGDNGGVEIKCPQPTEHIRILLGGVIPRNYMLQMQWNMACTGRKWWDFVSFCPALPDNLALNVQRVDFDHDLVKEMESATIEFNRIVADMVARLQEKQAY